MAYAVGPPRPQLRTPRPAIAPYSQQLGDLFTWALSVLVNSQARIYRRHGDGRLHWISPGKVSLNRLRLHRWPGRSRWRRMGRPRWGDRGHVRGGNSWLPLLSTFMAAK